MALAIKSREQVLPKKRKDRYRPALRIKSGEMAGVAALDPNVMNVCEPIFILLPPGERDPKTGTLFSERTLAPASASTIRKSWQGKKCFVSSEALTDQSMGKSAAEWLPQVFGKLKADGLNFIPAIPLSTLLGLAEHASEKSHFFVDGLMIIASLEDLTSGDFLSNTKLISKRFGVKQQDIELLIKIEGIPLELIASNPSVLDEQLEDIAVSFAFRSITLQLSSFPNKIPQSRWAISRNPRTDFQVYTAVNAYFGGCFSYSDFPADHSKISLMASKKGGGRPIEHLRYLGQTNHLVSGGRAKSRGAASEKIRDVATRLIKDSEFMGAAFSKGDQYIHDIANGYKSGRPWDWRQASVNHHLVVTVKELGLAEIRPRTVEDVEQLELEDMGDASDYNNF